MSDTSNYKAIIFDIGNVIFDISFDLVFDHIEKLTGKNAADIKAKFIFNEVFESFERGHITPEEFLKEVNRQTDLNLSLEEFDASWNAIYLDAFDGVDELLIHLNKTYRVVALSNTNILHTNDWLIRYKDTVKHFEKIFASNEIGARKPDREAFQIVLDYLEMLPEEVIFIDDNLKNIQGAEVMGIRTIHVKSYPQMRMDLDEILYKK
jgi:epoxide hydrolase-like predicted phosphatase